MKFYVDTHLVSQANLADFKKETLDELDNDDLDVPDETTTKSYLSSNYDAAAQATPAIDTDANPGGETLLQKVKDAVCEALKSIENNDSNVFDAIMSALEEIMPGGILIKWFIKGVVHFLLKLGEDAICGSKTAVSTTSGGE